MLTLLLLRDWVTMSKKLLVLLVAVFVLGIFLVGCGGDEAQADARTPVVTRNEPPEYQPTFEDFHAAFLAAGGDSTGARGKAFGIEGREDEFSMVAATYMAYTCVNSIPTSPSGFREYATELGFVNISRDARSIGVGASELMGTIVDKAEDRIKRGIPPSETLCEGSYMYPDSASDAWLVSGLVSAVRQMHTSPYARRYAHDAVDNKTLRWFGEETSTRPPLLLWTVAPLPRPEIMFVRGRSIELHVSNPVVKSTISFSDDDGRHRVIRPRASNRQLVLVNVTVVNRTSTVMPMLIDKEAAELGDRRGERIEVLDPFESSFFVEAPDEHENEFFPLLWGEVLLDRQFQVGGWMIFDVPKDLTIGSLWWNEIDEVVVDYIDYMP